jgi:hypothetical protein
MKKYYETNMGKNNRYYLLCQRKVKNYNKVSFVLINKKDLMCMK